MNWNVRSQIVAQNTVLGRREAQIAVLNAEEHTNKEIVAEIERLEDHAPAKETVASIISKNKNKSIDSGLASQVIHRGVDALKPSSVAYKHGSRSNEVHAYIGDIGSGKTITIRQTVRELSDTTSETEFVVVDPLGQWNDFADSYENVSTVSAEDIIELTQEEGTTEEFLELVSEELPAEGAEIIVDNLHGIARVFPDAVSRLTELNGDHAVRVAAQRWETIENVDVDYYHFHKLNDPEIEKLGLGTTLTPASRIGDTVECLSVSDGSPTAFLTVDEETGDTQLTVTVWTGEQSGE